MGGTYSIVKTVVVGETITASDRNAEHSNHILYADFSGLGGYSATPTEMRATRDPNPGGSISLATDGKNELKGLRYQILEILKLFDSTITSWEKDVPGPAFAFGAKGADVASANALVLGTDGNYFDITGTTNITSIGTLGVGSRVTLHFDGVLTVTHHATDLILPSGNNIVTQAGDELTFVEYASGDWRLISANRLVNVKNADIASATALPVLAPGYADVTGTVTITSINSLGIGSIIRLHFDGALILAQHATNLVLPAGQNITTVAGDEATFVEYTTGNWRCIGYFPFGEPKRVTMWHDESVVTFGNSLVTDLDAAQRYSSLSYQTTSAEADQFTQDFVLKDGTYTLSVLGAKDSSHGFIDWYVDGVLQFSGQDWYAAGITYNVIQSGSITVVGGAPHQLRGVVHLKNGSSSNFFMKLTKFWIN